MLMNASILSCTLLLTSLLIIIGLYYTLYQQARNEVNLSIQGTLEIIDRMSQSPLSAGIEVPDYHPAEYENLLPPAFARRLCRSNVMLPGVVLRITDDEGTQLFDSNPHHPTLARIQQNLVESHPFWMSEAMQIAVLEDSLVYYKIMPIEWKGHIYHFHFLRMITAERSFLRLLTHSLLLTNAIGLLLTLLACYYVIRKVLDPLAAITRAAKEIEVTDLRRRLPVPATEGEMKQLVSTINHMLERIESGFEKQQRFVADASHELRTPVTVMLGYANMLGRWGKYDPETLDEGILAIRSEAENMKELIDRLLFLARTDLQRQILNWNVIDMEKLVADVVRKGKLTDDDHTLLLGENDPGYILGDEVTIRQMLRIFLENAIKYTPAGSYIKLSSKREGERLHLTVADTGIGIAPEHQKKIFERFYQVDSSRTTFSMKQDERGIGLGLPIAHWIAASHKFELRIESALGQGTTIHLYMPLLKDLPKGAAADPLAEAVGCGAAGASSAPLGEQPPAGDSQVGPPAEYQAGAPPGESHAAQQGEPSAETQAEAPTEKTK